MVRPANTRARDRFEFNEYRQRMMLNFYSHDQLFPRQEIQDTTNWPHARILAENTGEYLVQCSPPLEEMEFDQWIPEESLEHSELAVVEFYGRTYALSAGRSEGIT